MVTPVFGIGFSAMASQCEVHLAARDGCEANQLAQVAIDEVRRIEAKYSRFREGTVVSRINAQAGRDWTAFDAETEALFAYADTLFDSSGGLFDITSGVLRQAWDFRAGRRPQEAELAPLLELIGWHKADRAPGKLRLPLAGMEIDFGGFGKEYAADRAAALLTAQGVTHGYVNLGGDLRIIGPQPDGTPWQIGIQDPRDKNALAATIPVHTGALATSGDYERFFEQDGQRYCHILDPRTGHSVNCWRSVSVLAPVAIAAGSYATIAMLKQEAGLAFLQESGLAFLAIDRDGQVHQG
ncbi:MAG: FAD:protein FMN transferase [Pseudomonadota bacterium]